MAGPKCKQEFQELRLGEVWMKIPEQTSAKEGLDWNRTVVLLRPCTRMVPAWKEAQEELREREDFPGIRRKSSQSVLGTSTEQSGRRSPRKGFFALSWVVKVNVEFPRLELNFTPQI